MLLQDKIVVISGIGPGLGIHLAVRAAKEGARGLSVVSRTAANLDETERKVAEVSPSCVVLKCLGDIRKAEDCERIAKATIEKFGRVDALVNNAYVGLPPGDFEDADLDKWIGPYETNLIGTLRLTQAFLPQMKKQGGAAIVNVNTDGAKYTPYVNVSGYAASKAALASATRSLAFELGKYQIRVNGIHMGTMWGPYTESFIRRLGDEWGCGYEKAKAKIEDMRALKRFPTDVESAPSVLFLASDFSSAITGASVDCNGGAFMP